MTSMDARQALWYWGDCHARRIHEPDPVRMKDKMAALLHGVPKANQKAIIDAYLKKHREGFGSPVIPAGGCQYEPMSSSTYRLADDPHNGFFIFLAVELVLMDLLPHYRVMAVWRYVRKGKVGAFPSPQTHEAKRKMSERLVRMVSQRLDLQECDIAA